MVSEKLKILDIAWKIFNSGKYPKSKILIGHNTFKGRSFAGILCTLLKEKLNLLWVETDDYVFIGKKGLVSTLPIEIANYFSAGSEAQFLPDGEILYNFLLHKTKKIM